MFQNEGKGYIGYNRFRFYEIVCGIVSYFDYIVKFVDFYDVVKMEKCLLFDVSLVD